MAEPNVSLREAVEAARMFLMGLQGFIGGLSKDEIWLEEIELSEDKHYWRITMSFPRPVDNPLVPTQQQRDYKLFEISTVTGEVKAMRIRTL